MKDLEVVLRGQKRMIQGQKTIKENVTVKFPQKKPNHTKHVTKNI